MPDYRILVSMNSASGTPEDRTVNTFALRHDTVATDPELEVALDKIEYFYTGLPTGQSVELSNWLSDSVAHTGHTMDVYRLDVPGPHLPLAHRDWSLVNPSNAGGLPEEVALCLSFAGAPVAGTNTGPGPHLPARHRGRIFFGPLRADAASFQTNAVRPIEELQQDLATSGAFLMTEPVSLPDWHWTVWSSTNGSSDDVVRGWVDDAFDTQRRRGHKASSRISFP